MAKKTAALPFILFGLIVSLLVGSRFLVQERERSGIVARLETTSQQVSTRLETFLEKPLEEFAALADDLSASPTLEESDFRARSLNFQVNKKGVQALNLVDPSGTIRWVEPEIGNRGALGFDLSNHPIAGPAFRAARNGNLVELTPPLPLLQRGWGIAAYYRIHSGEETIGLANCVFRLSDILEECIHGMAEPNFGYVLHFGDESVASLGALAPASPGTISREVPVYFRDHELMLSVTSSPIGASHGTWGDEALLGLGVLLAGLLVWMVQVARRRYGQAEIAAERFRVLHENAPDAILILDADSGALLDGNRRAFELFDYSREDFLGLSPQAISPAQQPDGRDSHATFLERLAAASQGATPVFEWTIQTSRGFHRLTEVHLVAMPSDGRKLVRTSLMDISHRRELEDKLRRTHVHEAVGQLAGGVAHDFNNMLTAILGTCELLRERCQGDPQSVDLADGAIEACQRASQLTRRLLTFSKAPSAQAGVVDLNAVISGLLPMLSRVISARVHLVTQLNASSPILGSASEIELVLLNLVVNARDAMPTGGTITISSEDRGPNSVGFRVQDEGEGIPPEILEKVFEPFFTTKGADAGTGIGLATARQIIDQAGGKITVASTVGIGTEFVVCFPAHSVAAANATSSGVATKDADIPASATILVVEDDETVRSLVQRTLSTCGYGTIVASDAEQALTLAALHLGNIDLLITDAVLPGMGGLELVSELQAQRPDLPCLLVSGYPLKDPEVNLPDQLHLLSKPFTRAVLIEKVRAVLEPAPSAP